MKRIMLISVIVIAAVGCGLFLWQWRRGQETKDLILHGNMDLRQVDLAFNNSERIVEVLAQEGDRVSRGQLLARLDTSRLEPQLAQVEAQAAAQRQVVLRLKNGTRPEEIAQARANVESSRADVANARTNAERLTSAAEVSGGRAVRQQDVDNAKTALEVAQARLVVNQRALELALAGPRKEEIAENEARLRASEAQAALLRQQLADSRLVAPMDAVVRTRVMEPGEMASPQKTALTLAITDPKWARVYVSEPDLGKIRPGMAAYVIADSFPGRRFEGWIGFISPVAEFTPKSVETVELRSSLVYEVRVFVKDPNDELRLGMPASAYVSPQNQAKSPADDKSARDQK